MFEESAATQPAGPDDRAMGFDRILDRLRQVVAQLEQGNLSLEQSLRAFEEGVRLSRQGAALLDAAEQRVDVLIRGEDGSLRTEPLGPGEGDGRG
ncbi:MAG: exodeoxyribonuclease VII small subunit [Myxococcales bacterium]|nr:exodeoxyribonuclease VII small subunit [Myxococcota bacterium]MDW8283304.1 exodeoxyribonuclease VII small subunit [Myxococcales bacterium]